MLATGSEGLTSNMVQWRTGLLSSAEDMDGRAIVVPIVDTLGKYDN